MHPDRWRDLERLYHGASACDPAERQAYLDAHCPDAELRTEVAILLALDAQRSDFLAEPGRERAENGTRPGRVLPALPFTLGPYQVLAPLGAGGMGRVYQARDVRLQRHVAVKLLPEHLSRDPVARERLRREAIAAAALDHPFICKIFEVAEHDGTLLVAMELVVGETLAARLRAGPIDGSEGMRLAGEIAEALEAAHSHHVVHRDLKPANVMLTSQGRVKVMDFGLAKYLPEPDATPTSSGVPRDLTGMGVRLGTPAYMCPEQITGSGLDARSDLFSLGIVLCEIFTGGHPFRRPTTAATIAAILHEPPDIDVSRLPSATAMLLVLKRLLAKEPCERHQTVGDLREDLARLAHGATVPIMTAPSADTGPGPRWPLVGRDAERVNIVKRVDDAVGGRGSMLLIGGEPGIGKSRLAQESMTVGRERGCLCLLGHAREGEGASPYAPFVEMLEQLADLVSPAHLRAMLGDSAPEIVTLMPGLTRIVGDIPPVSDIPAAQQRRHFFNAYRDYVRRLGRTTPLVFVFEDLQWSDEPTLQLLQHLAEALPSIPLLVIGTYRDIELDVSRPLAQSLERLVRERLAQRISLRRLAVGSVEALLAHMSGQRPPQVLTRTIFEHTEGNPFFVEEVFQHLSEEGRLFDSSGVWQPDLQIAAVQVPESLRLVIGRRLERLAESTRHVLATAAIIGRVFPLDVLQALQSSSADSLMEAVEEAEAARLIALESAARQPRYRFVHELIRQTLVDAASLPRRQRLHARIAEAIEHLHAANLDAHAPSLAHHLVQAGAAVDPEKTRAFLVMAAEQAQASTAYEEAVTLLDSAIVVLEGETSARVAELHKRRADALRSLGRFELACRAYGHAIDLYERVGDTERVGATTLPLTLIHAWNAAGREHLAATTRALALVGDDQPAMRCRLMLLHALGLSTCGDAEHGLATLDEALAMEAAIADPALHGFAQILEAHVCYQMMLIRRSTEASRAAMQACERAGDAWGHVDMEWNQAIAATYFGRLAEVRQRLAQATPHAERVGHHVVLWFYRLIGAMLDLSDGRLSEAEHEASETVAIGEHYGIAWIFFSDLSLAQIRMYRGDEAGATAYFRKAIAREPACYWSGLSRAALFAAAAEEGRQDALDVLREGEVRLPDPKKANPFGAWVALTHVVEGLAACGRRAEAGALHPSAEALVASGLECFRDMRLFRTAAGVAAASAGEWARAEQHHRAAIELADATPFRVAQPVGRVWYARMLRDRGGRTDAAQARVLLEEARTMFTTLEMPGFARRTGQLLAEHDGC